MSVLPTEPGMYHWTEWDRVVRVYRNTPSGPLWVRVYEHWQPVRISPRIAGRFIPVRSS